MLGMIAKPFAISAITSANTWSTVYPLTNMMNNDYGRVAQSAALSTGNSVTFVVDLGAALSADCVALLWTNMTSSDVMLVKASNDPSFATANVLFNSGVVAAVTGVTSRDSLSTWKFIMTLGTAVTARYWSFTYTTAAAKANGVQISRAMVGKRAQFAYGPAKATLSGKDLNTSITTEVGEERSQEDPLLIRPVVSLSFSFEKQSEMEQVVGGYTLALGTSKPLLICTDLTSSYIQDNVAFGRLEQVISHESDTYDVWSFDCVVTSIGP